jgi:hypothetical protein
MLCFLTRELTAELLLLPTIIEIRIILKSLSIYTLRRTLRYARNNPLRSIRQSELQSTKYRRVHFETHLMKK